MMMIIIIKRKQLTFSATLVHCMTHCENRTIIIITENTRAYEDAKETVTCLFHTVR